MRINAYVMAADPAWIEASVLSYYDLVEKIIVSYDADGLSWSGIPLPIEQCVERLRRVDSERKLQFSPGRFALREFNPMKNDTLQRQSALDLAGIGADWVLQLDTDEVIADKSVFADCLAEADRKGFNGLEYPARWLYKAVGGGLYLERCSRFWRTVAGFPGPVAVRPGARLRNARQCDASLFRVDFNKRNTDPCHSPHAPVHRVVSSRQGIIHYSWIRSEEELERKTAAWGHSQDNWETEIRHWKWAGRHPVLASFATPFMNFHRRLRLTAIPDPCSNRAPVALAADSSI